MPEHVGSRGSPRIGLSTIRRLAARTAAALAGAALAGAAPAATSFSLSPHAMSPAAPAAAPALWVVSDEDTTIFLFGTFHALDPATDWFAPPIQAAFAVSDELVLETVVPSDPRELGAALERNRLIAPPVPGQPVLANERARPFVQSTGQAIAAGRSIGMTVESGADAVLRRVAERLGKKVDGLESFDAQVGMVDALSSARVYAPAVADQQRPAPPVAEVMRMMRDSWKAGEAGRFAAMLGSIERQSPDTYRILFADRNERWAQWIADRLDQPGTAFVAVGAGHFVGRDSVQSRLSQRGIRASRIS